MKKGRIFIISGPSGSGKTTLYKKLIAERKSLAKSISATTRAKRPGEQHGKDYFFVSKKMFLYKKRAGHFLESEKVFDNYYGTTKKYVLDRIKKGKSVLLCIDVKGAKTIFRKYPEAVSIFVKTPSIEILKKRLLARGSESKKIVDLRLKTAKEELKETGKYDYIIINDYISSAYKKLKEIIDNELKK